MSKAEDRARRKAEKVAKFEEQRATLIEKIAPSARPKTAVDTSLVDVPKVSPSLQVDAEKQPKAVADGGRFDKLVTWCTTKKDTEGAWSWDEPRQWTDDEWSLTIDPAFREFAQMTWAHVDSLSSGSEHKMHHAQSYERIVHEAQKRWMHLKLGEFADSIFRFRLGGTRRAWGYIVQAHFHFVWWERHHKLHRKKNKKS